MNSMIIGMILLDYNHTCTLKATRIYTVLAKNQIKI